MKHIMMKSVFGAVAGIALVVSAGVASAGRPTPGAGVGADCTAVFGTDNPFQAACVDNQNVAAGDLGYGAYTGSCDGGAACADSVYNKLTSAAAKFAKAKVADGCANLLSIQSDLTTWNTAAKKKIDDLGYATMSAAISAIQTGNCY